MITEISMALLVAITIGLVQVIKKAGLPLNLIPTAALFVGIGLAFLAMPIEAMSVYQTIFTGIVAGLSSVGLFSGVKNTVGK